MKRYAGNKINRKRNLDGPSPEYYSSTFYPKIDRHESDIYVITVQGDRLDSLAWKYYGDTTLWWVIAAANNVGKGGLTLDSGLQIRIPQRMDKVMSDYKKIQRER